MASAVCSGPVSLACNVASEGLSCGLSYCDREEAATALAERVVRDPLPFLVTATQIGAMTPDQYSALVDLVT